MKLERNIKWILLQGCYIEGSEIEEHENIEVRLKDGKTVQESTKKCMKRKNDRRRHLKKWKYKNERKKKDVRR